MKSSHIILLLIGAVSVALIAIFRPAVGHEDVDLLRDMQFSAMQTKRADWGYWGTKPDKYAGLDGHSNRLIPVYTFGISLDLIQGKNSVYRSQTRLQQIYGRLPNLTQDDRAEYFDQTDIYRLQKLAIEQGKKNIILIVFDGMDWQITQAAAAYRSKSVTYQSGRGSGLAFQDYDLVETDFGFMVTSPYNNSTQVDVNGQIIKVGNEEMFGGYNPRLGGYYPWSIPVSNPYLINQDRSSYHAVTDSAASAASMTSGIKTFNGSINVDPFGKQVATIAHDLQEQEFSIGIVTSVTISHATPASAYAHNVSRDDYQDLTRDLLGLPSISKRKPLAGVDVLIGCGWNESVTKASEIKTETEQQGQNFVPGNKYVAKIDWPSIDQEQFGKYQIAIRQDGISGAEALQRAANQANTDNSRLFGFYGIQGGHLPYATADGRFNPTAGRDDFDVYDPNDVIENPTLTDMTLAALTVLGENEKGFWLLLESGDVDWAMHNNNVDDAVGAIYSGEAAFQAVCRWAEQNDRWKDTAVILTADHGHLFVLDRPNAFQAAYEQPLGSRSTGHKTNPSK